MKKILPYFVLLLIVASVLVPVGIGYTEGEVKLEVTAGEYDIPEFSFRASPAKSFYEVNGIYAFWFTVTNLSERSGMFDINGAQYELVPRITKFYRRFELTGQTEKIWITKVNEGNGIRVQEALVLKIEPKFGKKGGDMR